MSGAHNHFKRILVLIVSQMLAAMAAMLILDKYVNDKNIFIANLAFYTLIFILPVFIYIRNTYGVSPLTYTELNKNTLRGVITGVTIALFISLIFFVKNKFSLNFNMFNLPALAGVLLAGVFEEIPIRGFYLKEIADRIGFWKANAITSAMFSIMHVKWLLSGNIIQLVMLFGIGIWLGYIYKESRSLWAPIIVHAVYNALTLIFVAN